MSGFLAVVVAGSVVALSHAASAGASGLATLVASSDLIVIGRVTGVDLFNRYGLTRLEVNDPGGVWYEGSEAYEPWDGDTLLLLTRDEPSEGQTVVAFVDYDSSSTCFFGTLSPISENGVVESGHRAVVGMSVIELKSEVEKELGCPDSTFACLVQEADLIGLADVESVNLDGLYGPTLVRVCELWHGHDSAEEQWDGHRLVLINRENMTLEPGDQLFFITRYDRDASSFISSLGLVADGGIVNGWDVLVGMRLGWVWAAIQKHAAATNPREHLYPPMGDR